MNGALRIPPKSGDRAAMIAGDSSGVLGDAVIIGLPYSIEALRRPHVSSDCGEPYVCVLLERLKSQSYAGSLHDAINRKRARDTELNGADTIKEQSKECDYFKR